MGLTRDGTSGSVAIAGARCVWRDLLHVTLALRGQVMMQNLGFCPAVVFLLRDETFTGRAVEHVPALERAAFGLPGGLIISASAAWHLAASNDRHCVFLQCFVVLVKYCGKGCDGPLSAFASAAGFAVYPCNFKCSKSSRALP